MKKNRKIYLLGTAIFQVDSLTPFLKPNDEGGVVVANIEKQDNQKADKKDLDPDFLMPAMLTNPPEPTKPIDAIINKKKRKWKK